ncbi:LOW QUALITY PROTEIN: conserved hypothetical protein, partial [Streptomyces sp. SPB78]
MRASVPPRFLLVGDSQTIGKAGDHTWRYRLWRHLRRCLGEDGFAFVGPREALYDVGADAAVSYAYPDEDFPQHARRHLAGWGEGWQHMAPLVGPAVRESGADVLLVALGLIDLGFYTNPEQTAENAHRFLTAAREARPGVRAVVLPVVAKRTGPAGAGVRGTGGAVQRVARQARRGSRLVRLAAAPRDGSGGLGPGARHVRRDAPGAERRAQTRRRLRHGAPSGVGDRGAVYGGV